ncbi:MAG TPA: hypothetical protein VIU93_12915, partial [Gallionellaceae bacterium]
LNGKRISPRSLDLDRNINHPLRIGGHGNVPLNGKRWKPRPGGRLAARSQAPESVRANVPQSRAIRQWHTRLRCMTR